VPPAAALSFGPARLDDDVERRQAAVDPEMATARYQRAALDAVPEAWLFLRAVWDDGARVVDFVVLDLNAAGERLAGRPRASVVGGSFRALFPIHQQLGLGEWYLSVAETGEAFEDERCVVEEDGEERWLHVRAVPIPGGIAIATRDIDDRRRVEAANERLAAILEASPDVVAISGTDGRLLYVNRAGRALLGLPEANGEVAYDLTVADVQPQFLPGGVLEAAQTDAVRHGLWRGETVLRKRDGRELPVEQVLLAHLGANGAPAYFSSVLRDITDRKQAEAALRSLSLVDELTGLYNRRGFLTVAAEALQRATERGAPVLVFYMDVDDFKQINDHYGHPTGDAALIEVANVLRATFREADVVGRLGGDEFVAFAVHGAGQDPTAIASAVLRRVQRHLNAANATGTHPYDIRLSVGVAGETRPPSDDDAPTRHEALLGDADVALYQEKCRRKAGRGLPPMTDSN
jgi:diguanylate cyclase (GGDEF)-like protein/PAS domain S-box-containing protein